MTGKVSQLHVFCVTTPTHPGLMITVGLLVLFAGFAALAGQTWGSGGGHRVGGPERLAEFVGALRGGRTIDELDG